MREQPLINLHGYERSARVIAGKHDLTVRVGGARDDRGGEGKTKVSANEIVLPPVGPDTTQRELDYNLSRVDYLGSLWRYGDEAQAKNLAELPIDQPIGYMYRLFNDERVARTAATEFRGSADLFSTSSEINWQGIINSPGFQQADPKIQAVLASACEAGSDWNLGSAGALSNLESKLSPEARTLKAKLDAERVPEMVRALKNGDDPLAVAKHVYNTLWEDDPDEQEQKERQQQDGGGSSGGKGEGEQSEGVPPSANPINPDHGQMDQKALADKGKAQRSDRDGDQIVFGRPPVEHTDEYKFEPPGNIRIIDTRECVVQGKHSSDEYIKYFVDACGDPRQSLSQSAAFANRIRRHIQAISAAYYEHNQKRGKLSSKNVYRVGLPRDAQTRQSERVFKQRRESDVLDTAVSVMIDVSGSMAGEEFLMTYAAACVLARAMTVLNVPCEINAFSTGESERHVRAHTSTRIFLVKGWDERVTDEQMWERFIVMSNAGLNSNNDSAALLWAYDRLLTDRNEKRKILIMQSDGSPAAGGCEMVGDDACLRHAARRVDDDPRIDLLGFGLGSCGVRAVKRYYNQHTGVENVSEIETKLFELIAKRMVGEARI